MIEKMDIGIFTWFGFMYPFDEIIKLIKNAGFQSVMTWWGDEFKEINGDKLIALHLHDNDGISDQHLLPFDGTVNWKNIMEY